MPTADELFVQGVAAQQTGDLDTAERCYRQLLSAFPNHAATLTNLGTVVAGRGHTDEAEQLYRAAVVANPDQLDANFKLGNLFRRSRRPHEAAAAYEEVLRVAPDAPAALVNLGLAVSDAGDWPRAVECFARAATVDPNLPETFNLLGDALARCGRREEAIGAFRESVARFPDAPRGHLNLGLHLAAAEATDEAIAAFERALELNPDYPEAHNALGVALETEGRADDAQSEYREATRLRPTFAEAWGNLGTSLSEQGHTAEAADALRQSLVLVPNPVIHSTLLVTNLYSPALSAEQLRDEHMAWAADHADRLAPAEPPRPRNPARLRVGYVFGEFRSRAAVGLLEALFNYHDRAQFHITAYPSAARRNEAVENLKQRADGWRPIGHLSDAAAAEAIRADEIDILVDLHGHTPGNRLLVFARKPVAMQISMFGYPATTGMTAMDFRITDTTTDPPGASDALYTEKLLRLPDIGWLYAPPTDAPPPNALPAANRRVVTFGCLNHPGKLSDPCAEAWAAILKAVPKSRLVVLVGQTVASAEAFAARFTRLGIASDRIEPVYRLSANDYFDAYQPLDLALDPLPYNGAVTTCDALWMGVPVLTVAGNDARGRQGISLLNALGLPEFVADTPEQLVNLAATWADQRESLAELRATLRDMVSQSPLTAAAEFVKHLEAAYRSV